MLCGSNMRGEQAKKLCPEINLVQVPVAHEKADLTIYRDAGSEVSPGLINFPVG